MITTKCGKVYPTSRWPLVSSKDPLLDPYTALIFTVHNLARMACSSSYILSRFLLYMYDLSTNIQNVRFRPGKIQQCEQNVSSMKAGIH